MVKPSERMAAAAASMGGRLRIGQTGTLSIVSIVRQPTVAAHRVMAAAGRVSTLLGSDGNRGDS